MSTYTHPNYGTLTGIKHVTTYESGMIKACKFEEPFTLNTDYGDLVPAYGEVNVRKRNGYDLEFFDNGEIKAINLEDSVIIETLFGSFPAERLSFYPSGKLHRLFPLNGQISGYWSEEDEAALTTPYTLELTVGTITAKIISFSFYESGALKSLTIWPGQMIELNSPDGPVKCRFGFSLYEDGTLHSFEPAIPEPLTTPAGVILAFDPNAHGINCDINSVVYKKEGAIQALKTIHSGIQAILSGEEILIKALMIPSMINPEVSVPNPLIIRFDTDEVFIRQNNTAYTLFIKDIIKSILVEEPQISGCGDCSSCSSCSHSG
ncbi:hypothetical protein Q5O24_02815 [Eubacteriaceae bacterium ES3]|nr:hypothetical protein Q5O24_02815 [Eubacteriaceae bacterium ES3]